MTWWVLQGSNLRPTACKAVALPTELNTRNVKKRALYRRPSGSQDPGESKRVLGRYFDRRGAAYRETLRSIGATTGSASEENAKAT